MPIKESKQTFQDIFKIEKRGLQRKAANEYEKLCINENDMRSCRHLGILRYNFGQKTLGRKYLALSCESGNKEACNYLALLYERLKKKRTAKRLYAKACKLGHKGSCLIRNER